MIPKQDYTATITSGDFQMGGATIAVTPAMMDLLSKQMYTDQILAVIREPICNARDIQVETGIERPLTLHLPTVVEPYYYIRDYGTGLTEEQVVGYKESYNGFNELGEKVTLERFVPGLYLSYGVSTKTSSNDSIGGLGIGCKSPLAYSESFIVESFQEGIHKTYSIFKDQGEPKVVKLSETMTTEANGFMVKIAVRTEDTQEFAEKAAKFLTFFGYPVDVIGNKHNQNFEAKPNVVMQSDLYTSYESNWAQRSKVAVLMGGVVYSISDDYAKTLENIVQQDYMLLNFDIGTLTVAGSREGLSEDAETQALLEARVKDVLAVFYKDVVIAIDKCETPYGAQRLIHKFRLLTRSWVDGVPVMKAASPQIEALRLDGGTTSIVNYLAKYDERFRHLTSRPGRKVNDRVERLRDISASNPVVLLIDKKTGYLKVAKHYLSKGQEVIFTEDSFGIDLIKEFFGSTIKVLSLQAEYEQLFPKAAKGAATTKIKQSGLSDHRFRAVETLESDQEGYYIPMTRDLCDIVDFKKLTPMYRHSLYTARKSNHQENVKKYFDLLVGAEIFAKEEIFYSRKGGLAAVKKTKLKPLTYEIVAARLKAKVSKIDMELIIKNSIRPCLTSLGVQVGNRPLWDHIKADYPLHSEDAPALTEAQLVLAGADSRSPLYLLEEFDTMRAERQEAIAAELKLITEEHALVFSCNSYDLTPALVNDLIAFTDFKRANTLNNEEV